METSKKIVIKTKNPQESQKIAESLAKFLSGGEIIILEGDLGSGKTTFIQGLARALGVKQSVLSPSFILQQKFLTSKNFNLIHIDLYRLKGGFDPELLEDLGDPGSVAVVEWGDKIKDYLKEYLIIKCSHSNKENEREITLEAFGKKAGKILKELKDDIGN